MCGIAGCYNFSGSIETILSQQAHRGPDASGLCQLPLHNGETLQLGHNRLKIICLSDVANQPFSDSTKQHYLVFNGEIYNYLSLRQELERLGVLFQTDSDTEVLLQALITWGMEALDKINGMFAFAYFNSKTQQLFLVRDRFGVKPLYYFINDNQLVFASSSASLAKQLNLSPNYAYLQTGLQYGIYEEGSAHTAYQGLSSVLSGGYLRITFSKRLCYEVARYYDLKKRVGLLREELSSSTSQQWVDRVSAHLNNACQLRLQADVPIAIALSGGLDSSAVAAIAKHYTNDLQAFCFGSPNDKASEGVLAEQLAKQHQLPIAFIKPTDEAWEEAFWQTLAFQDAPFAGMSVVAQYLLYQAIKARGYKVVLGGQGGDEAFLGYRKFQLFYLKELIEKKSWLQAVGFFTMFSQMLWSERARLVTFWQLRAKYGKQGHQQFPLQLPSELMHLNIGYGGDIYQRQLDDVLHYSLPTLLRYEDRNSMAHSIESRLPFMDYQLMELACAMPTPLKLHKGFGKWAIRDLMKHQMPDNIRLARYKRGFDVSPSASMIKLIANSAQAHLSDYHAALKPFLGKIIPRTYFSAEHLTKYPNRFNELTILCWLANKC